MNTVTNMNPANLAAIDVSRRTNGQFGPWEAAEAPTPDVTDTHTDTDTAAAGSTVYRDRDTAIEWEIRDQLDGAAYNLDAVADEVLEWHGRVINEPGLYLNVSGYRRRAGIDADELARIADKHRTSPAATSPQERSAARAEAWEKTAAWAGYSDIEDFPTYQPFMDDDEAIRYLEAVSAVLHVHNETAADGLDIVVHSGGTYGPNEYALTVRVDTAAGSVRVLSDDEPLAAAVAGARPDNATDTFRRMHDAMLAQRTRFAEKVNELRRPT